MGEKLNSDRLSGKKITAASILFMGLGHIIFLKQYYKGAFFAIIELIFIFNIPNIVTKINNLITLGIPKLNMPVQLRDNSIFMLIDGVITIAIIFVFIFIYVISVKSARSMYKDYCNTKVLPLNNKVLLELPNKAFPLLGLVPTVLLLTFFVIVPLMFSALVAFTNYSAPKNIPPAKTIDWVGFDNFQAMFGGNATWTGALGRVALWTLAWGVLATVTCYFGGMIMAVILNDSKIKIAPIFRGFFILPYAIPTVVSMLIWQNLLNGTFGTINATLIDIGLIDNAIPWLSDPMLAKFTVVMINLWAGFPYFMLLITGTMTSISKDLYEAAEIDGANKFQSFKKITLPTVLYQTLPLIIMSFTHNINNFGAIFFLSGGNPKVPDTTTTTAGGTDIIVTWIYKLTVNLMRYNYASVLAIMVFMILAPFAIFNFMRTKSFKDGDF